MRKRLFVPAVALAIAGFSYAGWTAAADPDDSPSHRQPSGQTTSTTLVECNVPATVQKQIDAGTEVLIDCPIKVDPDNVGVLEPTAR